jgi:hypothetical protein
MEWQPEDNAPEGRWLLVRTTRDISDPSSVKNAVKIGGLWWQADKNHRELEPLMIFDKIGEPLIPNWRESYSPWGPFMGPMQRYTNIPDEWCDIPTDVLSRLVNRRQIP